MTISSRDVWLGIQKKIIARGISFLLSYLLDISSIDPTFFKKF